MLDRLTDGQIDDLNNSDVVMSIVRENVQAAVASADNDHRRRMALAARKILTNGIDDAVVDDEVILHRTLISLDTPHVQMLSIIREYGDGGVDDVDKRVGNAWPGSDVSLFALLGDLGAHRLAKTLRGDTDAGDGERGNEAWVATVFGRAFLDWLTTLDA
jgi:hypothetical protein